MARLGRAFPNQRKPPYRLPPGVPVGVAALTGAGILTASAIVIEIASAPLSGAGILSATAIDIVIAGGDLSGAGSLASTAVDIQFGIAGLAGTSTLAVAAINIEIATAALSGTSTLVATWVDATTEHAVLITHPDEVATGLSVTLIAEHYDATGALVALDATPQIRIYSVSPTTGAETNEVATTNMTQLGSSNAWSYAWTPSASGSYQLLVTATYGGGLNRLLAGRSVSARPKFDPIALADGDVLVARM